MPLVPARVTPNAVTWFGCAAALAAGAAFGLASQHVAWLAVGCALIWTYWLADNVDGELARARAQTSERGYFLDMALDPISFTAIYLGLGVSGVVRFPIAVGCVVITMFHDKLIDQWIHLRGRMVFANSGPTQVMVILTVLAIAHAVKPGPLVTLADVPLGLFDLGLLVGQAWGWIELLVSAVKLYRLLDGPKAP